MLVSALLFGAAAWTDWIAAVPRFQHMVMTSWGLERGMITPTALGHTLQLDPAAQDIWRLAFGLGAAVMAWMVFRRSADPARRLAALLGGGLFVTPYAMHYDAALLVAGGRADADPSHSAGRPWIAAAVAERRALLRGDPALGRGGGDRLHARGRR